MKIRWLRKPFRMWLDVRVYPYQGGIHAHVQIGALFISTRI